MVNSGLLDGKDEICKFLNGMGYKKLKKLMSVKPHGLPILVEDGRWMAYKDNLEMWLKWYTGHDRINKLLKTGEINQDDYVDLE